MQIAKPEIAPFILTFALCILHCPPLEDAGPCLKSKAVPGMGEILHGDHWRSKLPAGGQNSLDMPGGKLYDSLRPGLFLGDRKHLSSKLLIGHPVNQSSPFRHEPD